MASVRGKTQAPLPRDETRQEIVNRPSGIDASVVRAKFISRNKKAVEGITLTGAPIVISGGRGLKGRGQFRPSKSLATSSGRRLGPRKPPLTKVGCPRRCRWG